ncbi:MAG: alpha/beta fold hydrolase, partial [Candidatus Binatia bacterium]
VEVFRRFSLPKGEMRSMDFRTALARVTCPALVVGGSEDPITPPHLSRELAESLRGRVRLELFDGCGHGAFHDDPARVFAVIRAFIAEHSS